MTPPETQTKLIGWIVAAAAAAAAVFALDLMTPLGYVVPMLYGIPLLITWFLPGLRSTLLMIGMAMPLTWGGAALFSGELTADALVNRIMASALLLVIGWLVINRKHLGEQRDADQALLLESEERYALVVAGAEAAIWDWNVSEQRVFFSPRWKALRGLADDEVSDHETEWSSRIHPDDRERVVGAIRAHLEGRTAVFAEEYRVRHKDGRCIWILDHGMAKRDSAGSVVRMAGSETDITARKQTEQRLRESEERLARILSSATDAIISVDERQRVALFNKAAEAMFRCTAEEAIDRPLDRFIPDRFRQAHRVQVEEFGHSGITARRMGHAATVYGLRANGQEFPAEASISRDERDGRKFYTVIVRDVTERIRAEDLLRQSREDLDRAQEVGQIGWWRLDTRRNVLTWSDENHRIFGVPKGTPLSYENFLALVHPDDREDVDRQWQAGLRGEPYDIEHRIVVDGQVKWVREKAYREFDEAGARLGGFGITQDITQRKEAEITAVEAKEQLQAILTAVDIGTWRWDLLRNTLVTDVNLKRLFYLEIEKELPLERYVERIASEDRARIETAIGSAIREGGVYKEEYQVDAPDGTQRWIHARGKVECDEGGTARTFSGVVLDITARKRAEAALRASEERLRMFIEHAPSALAMFNRKMDYLAVSRRWRDDYGLGDRPLIGRSHYDIFPEIRDRWKEVHQRGLAGEVVQEEEDRFERADGSLQWLRWEVRPWRESDGQVGGIVIFTEDITERKAASKALRDMNATLEQRVRERTAQLVEANERWDWVVRATNDGVWDWDLVRDTAYFSPHWKVMHGFQESDVPESTKEWHARIHPDDRPFILASLEGYLSGKAGEFWEEEYRIQQNNGAYFWVLDRGIAVRDKQGRAIRMVGADTDITWRKGIEEKLRFREQQFHTLANNVPALFAYVDRDRRYRFVNKQYEHLFGRSNDEITTMSVSDLLGLQGYAEVKPHLDQALAGEPVSFEYELKRPGGSGHVLSARYVPDRNDQGEVIGLFALNTDITALKSAEAQLREREAQLHDLGVRLLQAQEEERRRISRDLHDDVMQRMGALTLELYGLASSISSRDEGLQSQIKVCGASAEQLTTDLQRMAHQLHPSVLEFGGLEMAVREQVHDFGVRTGLSAEFIAKDVPRDIPLDHATCLYRVLQEGLQNVQKHANATTVLVRLVRTGHGLGLCIHDDGRGMESIEGTVRRRGLGLTSMAERVGMLNGTFRIQAIPNDGTELHAWVPLEEVKPET